MENGSQQMENLYIQTIISIASMIVSICAVTVSIYYNHKNHVQYLKSLEPSLTFKFFELDSRLFLKTINSGKSAAKDISIKILEIENNGENDSDFIFDKYQENKFDLYPGESTQDAITYWRKTLSNNSFPKIYIEVKYRNPISDKQIIFKRNVLFSPSYDNKIYCEINNADFDKINDSIYAIARANIRTANYLDGNKICAFDELDIISDRNLRDDLFRSKFKTRRR